MRFGLWTSIPAFLLGAGLALAQSAGQPGQPASSVFLRPTANATLASASSTPQTTEVVTEDYTPGTATEAPVEQGPSESDFRLWVTAEYLLWHIQNGSLPQISVMNTIPVPLGPPVNTTAKVTFVNTTVFPDGLSVNGSERSGGRITAGSWLDSEHDCGVEVSYFQLEKRTDSSSAQQQLTLADTPFVATFTTPVVTGPGTTTLVTQTVPGTFSGDLTVNLHANSTSRFWGTEADIRSCRFTFGEFSGDLLGGFRYLDLRETLDVFSSITFAPTGQLNNGSQTPLVIPPQNPVTLDSYSTRNQFYGPQIGASFDLREGRVFLEGIGKVALGEMHQVVNIAGAGIPFDHNGQAGVLTQAGDLGHHSRERIAFVLEPNVNLGYQFTPSIRAFVGYNLIFLENVARPAAQIGFSETTTQVTFNGSGTAPVTVRQPAFHFSEQDIFVQGINLGLEFHY